MVTKIHKPSRFARLVIYPLAGILFFLIFAGVITLANGYRPLISDGKLLLKKTGMFIVTSRPGEARIYINGKVTKNITTFPFLPVKISNILPGNYRVTVKRDGFRTWENWMTINPSLVTWVNYVLLFPNDLKIEKVSNLENKNILASSSNGRYLFVSEKVNAVDNYFVYDENNGDLNKIWPKTSAPAETHLKSPAIVEATFNSNNDKLLLKVKTDKGFDWAFLENNGSDGKITSVETRYKTNFERIITSPTDSNEFFGLLKGSVYHLNLTNATVGSPIATDVIDFFPEKNKQLYLVKLESGKTALVQEGFDGSRKVLITNAIVKSSSYKISYSSQKDVLLVLPKEDKTLTVYYRVNNQLNTIELAKGISDFKWSPNGKFIFYVNGNKIYRYDWEKQKETKSQLADSIKAVNWFYDENHFIVSSTKELFFIDYDNANKTVFSDSPVGNFFVDSRYTSVIFPNKEGRLVKFAGSF